MDVYVVRLPKLYLKGVYFKGVLIMYLKGCQIYIWKEVKYTFENKGRHNICSGEQGRLWYGNSTKGSCLFNGVKYKDVFGQLTFWWDKKFSRLRRLISPHILFLSFIKIYWYLFIHLHVTKWIWSSCQFQDLSFPDTIQGWTIELS